jgi:RimJ/RimL family protein N-acetyltransferase
VEIGGTWTDPTLWRTPFNTESKRLMLGYAFDTEHVHRVQLKTDLRNLRSQRAIERLGALREGVLREHLLVFGGVRRSSVYYSILEAEWPAVRDRLDAALARPWGGERPRAT